MYTFKQQSNRMIIHSIQLAIIQKGGFQVDTLLFQTYIHFQIGCSVDQQLLVSHEYISIQQ